MNKCPTCGKPITPKRVSVIEVKQYVPYVAYVITNTGRVVPVPPWEKIDG